MTASEIVGRDEGLASSPMTPSSPITPTSPRNRVKFLCSYGGKILPRPNDGKLKYFGGESRLVAVPRDIKFSELMKKVNSMVERDVIMKFLVIPDELDTLVTVKSDEDVKHMVDEYRRLESEGTPKLRVFLFPSNPTVVDNQTNPADPYTIEQRYIEAINGIVRPSSTNTSGRQTPVHLNRSNFSASASTSTSPKEPSPDPFANQHNRRPMMPKVRSSPSLYNLGNHHPQSNNSHSNHHPQSNNSHSNHQVYHYHQNHQQPQHYGAQSPRTPPDFWPEKPPPHDFPRGATMGHGHAPANRVYSMSRHNMGNNGYPGCTPCYCDDCMAHASGGSSRKTSPSTSGRFDKPDNPGPKN